MSGHDEDLLVVMPSRAEGAVRWYRFSADDGYGDAAWAETAPGADGDGSVALALPVDATTIHRFDLSTLTPAQAQAAAVRLAIEASIGGDQQLHAVATLPDDEGRVTVATIARDRMAHALEWATEQGIDPDVVVPVGLLLPAPDHGFICARLGEELVLRSSDLVLSDDEPMADLLTEGQAVRVLDERETGEVVAAALREPPLNLRQGVFATRRRVAVDQRAATRAAIWVGGALLVCLITSLGLIVKYHFDTRRLDDDSVAIARPFVSGALAPDQIEPQLIQKMASSGAIGVTGPIAALVRAMQPYPAVSVTLLNRGEDGLLRVTLAAARAEDINPVLLAIQAAGFRITATSATDPGGRVVAQITVEA